MAAAPSLNRQRCARPPRRWATAQALALALLLLVTQQWGLAHWLQHRGAAAAVQGAAAGATPGHAAADPARVSATAAAADADTAADTACVTCLALAGLGALVPPQPPVWAPAQAQASAPASRAVPALRAADRTPFHARAPPALS